MFEINNTILYSQWFFYRGIYTYLMSQQLNTTIKSFASPIQFLSFNENLFTQLLSLL